MTGLSQVNFDVQGLADEEEAQLDKEDAEREQELHELLSNELPDDLLDDDNISFASSGHNASIQGHKTPEFQTNQSYEQLGETQSIDRQVKGSQYKQQEYPQLNKISSLLTHRGEEFIERFTNSPPLENVYHPEPTARHLHQLSESLPRGYNGAGYNYMGSQEGFNEDNNEHHRQYTYHVGNDPVSEDDGEYYDHGDYDADNIGEYPGRGTRAYNDHDENFNVVYSREGAQPNIPQATTSIRSDMIDDYKVQYKRGGMLEVTDSQQEVIKNQVMQGEASVSPSTLELAQLQILHRARKRKLEDLTNEFSKKEEDYERQIRVLNHQLALMKGEHDGMTSSLKHAQEIATNHKNQVEELEHKLQNSYVEKEQINNEKNEIESELESAKKTIESLHKQLMELEKSESLSRAREQHDNVVMATKKRHEEDMSQLKQKLDDVNNMLLWKEEESKRLHDELAAARKEADRVRLDRAETVNRLTKSLEQSQNQNEELLNFGSTQELSQLQRQLSLTQHEKDNLEERYKIMEVDVSDLKEQLRIYESMSKLDIKDDTNDDVKRNLNADEWRTPAAQGAPISRKFSTEEALVELQRELQHSLTANRTKREEIHQLRGQLEEIQNVLVSKQNEIERLEMLVRKQEMRVLEQEKKISEYEELNRNPEEITREDEINKLQVFINEQSSKMEESIKREQELEQMNLQLKSQMSQMVLDHDTDKQKSVEQCRQSCLEFHDQAISTMKEQLTFEHDEQLAKLRDELEALTTELNRVKESYVVLSEESRWIEKRTEERCEEEANEKIKEVQAKYDEIKTCELLKLRQTLATEMEKTLEKEKIAWQKVEEQRLKNKIDTELALAKIDWNKDQQKRRKEATEKAVQVTEKEWLAKYESNDYQEELDKKINELKDEWEEMKRREEKQKLEELKTQMKEELDDKMNAARQEWGKLKAIEIEREIEKARENWQEELAKIVEQTELTAVEKAKTEWLKEQEKDNMSKEKEDVTQILTAAKTEWEREKTVEITNMMTSEKDKWEATAAEEKQQEIERAILLAEEKWNNEHLNKINSAVKEALDLAQETWSREKDSAVEAAVTQSLQSAKETWNENKIKEMEQILSNARKQWFTELNFKQISNTSPCSIKSTSSSEDVNKTFSYLEAQYSKNLKEFRETELKRASEEHERRFAETVEELEKKYEKQLREKKNIHEEQLEDITRKSQKEREAELKDLETEYQNKLENIVEEIEEKWREKKAALEEDWAGKFTKQKEELQTSYREKYEKERESLGRNMREKYEKGVEHARKKLEYQLKEKLQDAVERAKHDWEVEQEEERLAVEEQHLNKLETEQERLKNKMLKENEEKITQLENKSLLKIRKLEEQLKDEKERYKTDVENLHKQLQDIKQQRSEVMNSRIERKSFSDGVCKASQTDEVHNQSWISLAEIPNETNNYDKLNELRQQYLTTTAQLKDDLMKHAIGTRNNAVKAIRSEVMKERHSTAKQLRKYYLECLKQILDEDKQAYINNQATKSNEEKLKIMEKRLTLPGEKNETLNSHDSVLTTVTSLADMTSDFYQTDNENRIFKQTKDSPRKPRDFRKNDVTTERAKHKEREEINPKVETRRQISKSFLKEFESNSDGDSLSTESLDSILSQPIDLPPVIELLGQSSSDVLGFDRGAESNSSNGVETYHRQGNVTNKTARHRHERHRENTHSSKQSTRPNKQSTRPSKQDMHSNQRTTRHSRTNVGQGETQTDTQQSDENRSAALLKQRDSPRSPQRNIRHSEQKDTRESISITQENLHSNDQDRQKRKTYENLRDTRSLRSHEKARENNAQSEILHPVIKSKNSSNVTSSLRKPVCDVLPSKPLSPAAQSLGKFSYSMHSHKK